MAGRSAATRAFCSRAIRACPNRSSSGPPASDDLPVNGVYRGGSDHRKDGQAVGW
jgi:gamma-glutamyltranspeptidase/glutathione hydrolase